MGAAWRVSLAFFSSSPEGPFLSSDVRIAFLSTKARSLNSAVNSGSATHLLTLPEQVPKSKSDGLPQRFPRGVRHFEQTGTGNSRIVSSKRDPSQTLFETGQRRDEWQLRIRRNARIRTVRARRRQESTAAYSVKRWKKRRTSSANAATRAVRAKSIRNARRGEL